MSFDSLESSTYGSAPFELYRFSMGTQTWCLTSGEEPRVYINQTYAPDFIERTEIEHNQESNSGSIEVTIPLGSELAKEFISFVPPLPMWLTVFAGHDGDPDVVIRFKGRVQSAKFGDECVLTVESGTSAIRKKIPPMVYQQSCNRMHYSSACGANLAANSWTVKVAQINGFEIVVDHSASESFDFIAYWNFAFSHFTEVECPRVSWGVAQSADGRRMMISKQSAWDTFELKAPIAGLQVGDILTVSRGCRRTLTHCQFFGRTQSYMGFDLMPQTNPFSGVA